MNRPGLRHVGSAGLRTLRQRGMRGLARRAARVTLERLSTFEPRLPLLPEDIAHSSSVQLALPEARVPRGTPVRVGWVCPPGGPGSGGHTTMFRMIEALERAGHECHVFLYDQYGGDLAKHEAVIRAAWPSAHPIVRDATTGISGVDVALATSWESAHVLASRGVGPMRRAYFIQDYEPYFHPRGWEYALAEDSYRFGFRCISLGPMVAGLLRDELGVHSDVLDFGVDTAKYHLTNSGKRSGVVFFARPGIGRRGYELGTMALREFHSRRPDQPIHVFPSAASDMEFPVVRHGHLSAPDLNTLYNSVVAGVALSFTNVSLVPEEMLASGAVPVCNESELARACLDNPYVEWVNSTPTAIADRLEEVIARHEVSVSATDVAGSVVGRGWKLAQQELVRVVEHEAYGPRGPFDEEDKSRDLSAPYPQELS